MAIQSNNKSNKAKNDKPAPAAVKAPAPAAKAVAAPPPKAPAPSPKPAATKPRAPYEPTQEEIQTRAFEIYVSEGCKERNDLEYWLRAEKELRSQGQR
jgi:hypothetical protein